MTSKIQLTWTNIQENIDEVIDLLIQQDQKLTNCEYVSSLPFITLHKKVNSLLNFVDDGSCNERKLEMLQQRLLEESE